MKTYFSMDQRVNVISHFYSYKTEGVVVEVGKTICKVAFPHRVDPGMKDIRTFILRSGKELNQGGVAAHLYIIRALNSF